MKSNFQSRIDSISLSTILKYYKSKGIIIRSKSSLIDLAIEQLCAILVGNGKVEIFKTEVEALNFMKQCGLLEKGNKELIKVLQKESLHDEGFDPTYINGEVSRDLAEKVAEKLERGGEK